MILAPHPPPSYGALEHSSLSRPSPWLAWPCVPSTLSSSSAPHTRVNRVPPRGLSCLAIFLLALSKLTLVMLAPRRPFATVVPSLGPLRVCEALAATEPAKSSVAHLHRRCGAPDVVDLLSLEEATCARWHQAVTPFAGVFRAAPHPFS